MNSEINTAFVNAILADASYVEGLLTGDTGTALKDALETRFTAPLAQYVGEHFRVVTQYTESNLTGSGFSVTVFQDLLTNQQYIAFRGTEPEGGPADVFADLDAVAVSGFARAQVQAMVNWYMRAITSVDSPVIQVSSDFTGTTTASGTGTLQWGSLVKQSETSDSDPGSTRNSDSV
jgi:hypothetical protein